MQVVQVLLECLAPMRRQTRFVGRGSLHAFQRGCAGNGKLVQVSLELGITTETHSSSNAQDGCGIRFQTLRHETNAHQHEFSRVLLHRPDDFLPGLIQLSDAVGETQRIPPPVLRYVPLLHGASRRRDGTSHLSHITWKLSMRNKCSRSGWKCNKCGTKEVKSRRRQSVEALGRL